MAYCTSGSRGTTIAGASDACIAAARDACTADEIELDRRRCVFR
jgi:hypothetical protein